MHLMLVDNLLPPYQGRLETLDVHPHLGLQFTSCGCSVTPTPSKYFGPESGLFGPDSSPMITTYMSASRETCSTSGLMRLVLQRLAAASSSHLKVAGYIKRVEPDLPILLGGPHATMLHREIMERYNEFDVIVRHEAEQTIADVLTGLERRDFTSIPGITWRATERFQSVIKVTPGSPIVMDLDSLPIPSYELYPIEELELNLMRVEGRKGLSVRMHLLLNGLILSTFLSIEVTGKIGERNGSLERAIRGD